MDSAVAWDPQREPSLTEVLEYDRDEGISPKLKSQSPQQNWKTINAIF